MGNDSHIECSLINIKNCGGLTYPSHDVIVICNKAEAVIRLALRKSGGQYLLKEMSDIYLLNQVCKHFIGNSHLFKNLELHCHDQSALENHAVHLMRAIAAKYIKIRLYFIGRNQTINNEISVRQYCNKITLFKGH